MLAVREPGAKVEPKKTAVATVKPKTSEIQQTGTANIDAVYQIAATGNMAKLSTKEKLSYLNHVCVTNGLNPATRPIQLISFNGKTVMYATRECSAQLNKLHKLSVELISMVRMDKEAILMCTVRISSPDGRFGFGIGCVPFGATLKADAAANAYMKAHTKATRRGVLDFCGLGFLDESETDTIGNFKKDPMTVKEGKAAAKITATVDKVVEPEVVEPEVVEPEVVEELENKAAKRSPLSPPPGKEKKPNVEHPAMKEGTKHVFDSDKKSESADDKKFLYEEKGHRQALIRHIKGRFPEIKRSELSKLGSKYQFSATWKEVLDDLNAMKAEGKINYDN